jgi:hypothetical protein
LHICFLLLDLFVPAFFHFYQLNTFCQIVTRSIVPCHSILSVRKYKERWEFVQCLYFLQCVLPRFSRCSTSLFSRRIRNIKTTDSCVWLLQSSEYKEKDETDASCYYRNRLSEECVGSNVAGNKGPHICLLQVSWREENTAWTITTYAIKLQHSDIVVYKIPKLVR